MFLFVHRGSLLLCATSSWPGPLSLAGQTRSPSVCQVLLCCKAVNCLCFLSLITSLNISHCLCIFLFATPSLCIFSTSIFSSSSCSSSCLPPVSIWLHLCNLTPALLPPGLCCGGPQKRSGQMVSDDFRALLISTGNSLVLLLAWCSLEVSAGVRVSNSNSVLTSLRQSFSTMFWFESFLITLDQH